MSEADKIIAELTALRSYLDGSKNLDGWNWGERPAAKPPFWWRSYLVRIDQAATLIRRLEAENERVKEAHEVTAADLHSWMKLHANCSAELSLANEKNAAQAERIAKLEEALTNVRTAIETADPDVLVCTLWMPNKWPNETVVDHIDNALASAALGGDNG